MRGNTWRYQYVVDFTATKLIDRYDTDSESIESALDQASDYDRRMKFQVEVQYYVDQSISSTIYLLAWGSKFNKKETLPEITKTMAKYALRLREFTCYPDVGLVAGNL